jgi:hypothetical protein
MPNSSMRRWMPAASSRVEVFPLDVLDEGHRQRGLVGNLRTRQGTSARPAIWAARQRRSPAMIS